LLCLLTFIKRADGTIEAPKIKSGTKAELIYNGVKLNSVTKEVRETVSREGIESDWYLMWFGLENEDLVFFLFQNTSEDFQKVGQILGSVKLRGTITKTNREFSQIITFLENKVNLVSIPYFEELEIIAQTNEAVTQKIIKPRFFDIEKAKALFQITGKKGEELVAQYLDSQKAKKRILDYKWMNQSKESGYPYDFEIKHLDSSVVFSDAKTTSYTFPQKMIFSNQELRFINQCSNYDIFRVYNLNAEIPTMRFCKNINDLSQKLVPNIDAFGQGLVAYDAQIKELKLAISPLNKLLLFSSEIQLKFPRSV
jgi:hypothetical protein